MAYVSLYRKYRSQTFGDLIGQDHVVKTLQNAITSDRIAHSYLFTGPRGTGKTSTARLLAKALCCEAGPTPEPDNTCHICESITLGNCIDVMEMDAASESGVEEVREQIVDAMEYKPMVCRYKVFIIDEVHDLSSKAFDALLKTIEEPPPHVIFILATTEFNKVPTTIRSRCQKYDFHRASISDLVGRLSYVVKEEGFEAEPAAISAIARMADGGYRDALTLLEQAILTSEDSTITLARVYGQLGLVSEEVVDALLAAIQDSDIPKIMSLLAEVARHGRDPRSVIESMLYRLQDLTHAVYEVEAGTTDSSRDSALHETAVRLGRDSILRLRGDLAEAHRVIRDISIPRLWLESELIRLALPKPAPSALQTHSAPAPAPQPSRSNSAPTPQSPPGSEPRPKATPTQHASPREAAQPKAPPIESPAPQPKAPQAEGPVELWEAVRAGIPSETAIYKHLMESRGAELTHVELVVEITRQMDLDWLMASPGRTAHLHKLLREISSKDLSVRFRVTRSETTSIASGAVELPAEGQRLEELAREIFE